MQELSKQNVLLSIAISKATKMGKKIYFSKYLNVGDTYTADDLLNEDKVKDLINSRSKESPFAIPPMVYVQIVYAYYIPENNCYEINSKHVILVKGARRNPVTDEVEQVFSKEYVEGHIRSLFDSFAPTDAILSIEINNGRQY